MNVRAKLLSLLGAFFLLLAGIGLYGVYQLNTVNSAAADIRDNWMPGSRALGEIKFLMTRYRLTGTRQISATDPAQIAALDAMAAKMLSELDAATKRYLALMTGPEEQKLWDEVAKGWNSYLPEHAKLIEQAEKGDKAGAAEGFGGQALRLFDQTLDALNADMAFQDKGSQKAGEAAEATYFHAIWVTAIALVFALLFCAGAVVWAMKDLIAPINGLTLAMKQLADGDLSTSIPHTRRTDELGFMAGALEVFKDNLAAKRSADEAAAKESQTRLERAQRRALLTQQFERDIGTIVDIVAAASVQLSTTAEAVSASAAKTTMQSGAAAEASDDASSNVQTVASAAEELSGSIREITRQAQQSNAVAQAAAREAEDTTAAVRQLDEMAGRINSIVNLINDIAGQTNLLALNATIEAARAGDAGRGFAVVAAEVKALAEQTAKATAEISGQISAIQQSTTQTSGSIDTIAKTIGNMSGIAAAIATAVEEQGAATQEIARTASQTSHATAEVARNIAGVRQAAEVSGTASAEVLSASRDLSKQADALRNQVQTFLRAVQAA